MFNELNESQRNEFFETLSGIYSTYLKQGEPDEVWVSDWAMSFLSGSLDDYIEVKGVKKRKTSFQAFMHLYKQFLLEMFELDEWDAYALKLFGYFDVRQRDGIGMVTIFIERWIFAIRVAQNLTENPVVGWSADYTNDDFSVPEEYLPEDNFPLREQLAKCLEDPEWIRVRNEKCKAVLDAYLAENPPKPLTAADRKELDDHYRDAFGERNYWQRLTDQMQYNMYTHEVSKFPEGSVEVEPGIWEIPQPASKPDEAFDKEGTPIPPYTHEWNEAMRKKYFGWPDDDIQTNINF